MLFDTTYIPLIIGMAVITYLLRLVPVVFLSRKKLHPKLEQWLLLIPAAVLSALLAPTIFLKHENLSYTIDLSLNNFLLLASIPTFLVAWFIKNTFATICVGMASLAALRYFFPTGI